MIIVVRTIFYKNNKYYPKVLDKFYCMSFEFLDECLYKI